MKKKEENKLNEKVKQKCPKCECEIDDECKKCPSCGKKIPKSMFWFFVKMVLLFLLLIELLSSVGLIALIKNVQLYKYGNEFISELLYACFILIILLAFGNSYIFKEKRLKLVESLKLGWPIFVVSIVYLVLSIITVAEKGINVHVIINLILFCITIGITEELMCRGWLQNEFIERFSKNKKQTVISILLASLVFGIMHITNVISPTQNLFETILQIMNALAAGILLGSIYYKTKNIWAVVIIHAFYDFTIMLGETVYLRDCSTGIYNTSAVMVTLLFTLISMAIYILSAIIILRSDKGVQLPEQGEYNKTQNRNIIAVIIILIIIMIPENFIPGMDDTVVCYEYPTKVVKEGYEIVYMQMDYPSFELKNSIDDTSIRVYMSKKFIEDGNDNFSNVVLEDSEGNKVLLHAAEDIYVVDNDEYYEIMTYGDEEDGQLYHTTINKNEITSGIDYLNSVSNSFKEYLLPDISAIGGIVLRENGQKLPYVITNDNDAFTIEDGRVYILEIDEEK